MLVADLGDLDEPEVVFGLVGAVGAALGYFSEILESALKDNKYTVGFIQLSDFLRVLNLRTPLPPEGASEYQRVNALMLRGDELREVAGGGALALMVASHINAQRPKEPPRALPAHAYIIRQLKHPEEVEWLRRIYGPAFYLIGLYTPKKQREHHLRVVRGLKPAEVDDLINRDEGEAAQWGQQLRATFHLSDVFIEFGGDYRETAKLEAEAKRFVDLLFGNKIITPKYEEYGMSLANAAALRSGDLSRQVGASILSTSGEILALGMNDVPRSGGGLYWPTDPDDKRDFVKGFDYNEIMKQKILTEVLEKVDPEWSELTDKQREERIEEHATRLGSARIMNLTEFGRAVHAEMEAITAAARNGIAIGGATLFTTTFPCHNCAKHIVAAGISRVVYVEPYPKSMAMDLHDDSIALDDEGDGTSEGDEPGKDSDRPKKVRFEPFVGMAPRRYSALFSTVTPDGRRLKRKAKGGNVNTAPLGIREKASPLSYIERESAAAIEAQNIGKISAPGGG